MKEWIDRTEALALLAVKPQTLYAYVSRGHIAVRRETSGRRRSLYRADDVAQLAQRADTSRKPSVIAAGSMAWGEASIVTQISTVQRGRLIYRGEDAVVWSNTATLESTARLLWNSEAEVEMAVPQRQASTSLEALARLAVQSQPSAGRGAERLCRDSREAIGHVAAACGIRPGTALLHAGLAEAWLLERDAADAVRRALVLVADHELNASAFATRVAASTGAPIAACLLAGLSALCGPRHAGATAALTQMLDVAARDGVELTVQALLDRDASIPGFGHPLYPHGDVRAQALCERLQPDALMQALAQHVRAATGKLPNLDFGLVALARAASLPPDAPMTMFLLGRSVGWAAHAMEQAKDARLIRPRARYEGAFPPQAA